MRDLKPNVERAKMAIIFLSIVGFCELGLLISNYMQYNLMEETQKGMVLTIEIADANDTRHLIISILYLIALIITATTFILWFRRAYYNLERKVKIQYDELWAGGAWFVPIISLYYPYKIMKELYEHTTEYIQTYSNTQIKNANTTYVGWWWGFWMLSNVLGQILFRFGSEADTIEKIKVFSLLGMVAAICGVVGAFLAIKVVRDYSEIEKAYYNMMEIHIDTASQNTLSKLKEE